MNASWWGDDITDSLTTYSLCDSYKCFVGFNENFKMSQFSDIIMMELSLFLLVFYLSIFSNQFENGLGLSSYSAK